LTKLPLLLMTLKEPKKSSRTKLRKMTKELKFLKRSLRQQEIRQKLLIPAMMKLQRNLQPVNLILRKLKKEQMLVRPKLLNLKRS